MPRPRAGKITAVSPNLLAMVWDNENAVRMYLRRRSTSVAELGCRVVNDPAGVRLEVLGDRAPPPADTVVPPKVSEEDFESFADRVDALLLDQGEDSVDDDVARALMAGGLDARQAVETIIRKRAQALADASQPQVVKDTLAARKAAPDKDSPPVVSKAPPFRVQLVLPDVDLAAAELWAGRAMKLLNCDVVVLRGDVVMRSFLMPTRAPVAPAAPASTASARGAKKKDHWPVVEPLLLRVGGVAASEVQRALDWKTEPGPWFFRKWAEEHGRLADLVDHGVVDGQRMFSLSPPRR